ncbi:MAG: hypothetical protein OSA41_03025 [Erythrobacter sp.]|nr:hypothetical protein [Erythrobacter sp.]
MNKLLAGVAAISFCAAATPLSAETAEEDATAFGARQSVIHASLCLRVTSLPMSPASARAAKRFTRSTLLRARRRNARLPHSMS